DRENLRSLERMAAALGSGARLALLRDFDPDADGDEVPDPYYGGSRGFENVYRMIDAACRGLLDDLRDPDAPAP
ncbi:MAG: low molecular weight phosphotyrosine protein phosphatase, partial [Gemmatimonadota bacterium]